ncbi:MAG: YHS domain-containing (seleno)protein [Pseudomonadota bacterium]
MTQRRTFLSGMAAAAMVPALSARAADKPEIYTDMQGRALKGYDAVGYHVQRKPILGEDAFRVDWKDAIWLFATPANRDRFLNDPERWAPQYGGYCAWAIAKGWTRPINPKIYRIFDDKLYLNLNMKVHKEWLGSRHTFIAEADERWPGVLVRS